MEFWLRLFCAIILITISHGESCASRRGPLSSNQFVCTNITSRYLESERLVFNRTDWFSCEGCTLKSLSELTLNFSTNRITNLNLTNTRIESIGSSSFKKLPLLKLLLLKGNLLITLSDKTFDGLTRLLQLDLSSNYLNSLQDDVFEDLINLDVLNLNNNRIHNLQPRVFNNLTNLKYLYINNNDLTYLHPYIFKYLVNLKILYLENNKLQEISQLVFTNLNNLAFLYLSNNSLEVLSEYNFKKLTNLVDLQLRRNCLTEIPASSFNGLTILKYLYLGNNNITYLNTHSFVGLDSLLILDLTNNSLQNFSLDYVSPVPSLTTLWLENNNISEIITDSEMENHEHLRSIDLQSNNVKNFNYKLFYKKLLVLEEVLIGQNDVKCEFFLPMMDFFDGSNVTVCINHACNSTETLYFAEELCTLSYNQSDNALNKSQKLQINLIYFICLYLFLF